MMLSERSKSRKATDCVILFVWNIQNRKSVETVSRLVGKVGSNCSWIWSCSAEEWWNAVKLIVIMDHHCDYIKNHWTEHIWWVIVVNGWIVWYANYISISCCKKERRNEQMNKQRNKRQNKTGQGQMVVERPSHWHNCHQSSIQQTFTEAHRQESMNLLHKLKW